MVANKTFELVFELTDRVMRWFGFDQESSYELLPHAVAVATELVRSGIEDPTRADIEDADAVTGGRMVAMWEALHGPYARL